MRHRYELPIFLGSAILFAVYAGCSGEDPVDQLSGSTTTKTGGMGGAGGAGGSGTTASTTTGKTTTFTSTQTVPVTSTTGPTSVGSGGFDTCNDLPDGLCHTSKGEDCNCIDCEGSALCVPDLCTTDGFCSPTWDSCICPDCDANYSCADPVKKNCTDDGVCDSLLEGCVCPDCQTKEQCLDNVAACNGGAPDGTCDIETEDCACVDCFGRPGCVKCIADSNCNTNEPCYCPECNQTAYCSNPDTCIDDGICDALDEGCQCADCADFPECNGGMTTPATSAGNGSTGNGTGGNGTGGSP